MSKQGMIGIILLIMFLAVAGFNIRDSFQSWEECKECNENALRAEGCKAIVSALFSDSKISYTYYSDAKQWCHDSYER